MWFTSDKNLNRAPRFSEDSDKIKDTIESTKEPILRIEHRELEMLKADEERKQTEAKKECDEYYDRIRNDLLKEIELIKTKTYIDMYCPECHSELSYLYWEIKAGELVYPMCDAHFTYEERLRIN